MQTLSSLGSERLPVGIVSTCALRIRVDSTIKKDLGKVLPASKTSTPTIRATSIPIGYLPCWDCLTILVSRRRITPTAC